jgi:hypothetical protein
VRVTIVKSDARAREKPCLRCGLSLRKHLDDRHCPQCGLSVWLSLNANDALDGSNPSWLKRLSSAFWLMAATQWLPLVPLVMILLPRAANAPQRYALAALFVAIYLAVHNAFLLLATWPERRYPDRLGGYKLAVRIAAGFAIVMGVALAAVATARLKAGWPSHRLTAEQILRGYGAAAEDYEDDEDGDGGAATTAAATRPTTRLSQEQRDAIEEAMNLYAARDWWLTGAELALAAGALATFAYLRKLAVRAGRPKVARVCGWILLAPVVPLLKTFPVLALFLLAGLSSKIPIALAVVYYPLSLGLFVWFAMATRRAAVEATEHWARESRPPTPTSSA